jgi:hypothetical protein
MNCPVHVMSYDVMSSFWHSVNICLLFITFISKPEVHGIFQSNYQEVKLQGLTAWFLTATHSPRAECTAVSRCRWEARYVARHPRAEVHKWCCCAVHACTWCNGPSRHVTGEGRAASRIGGEGERTVCERDRWSACYGMVGVAGSTRPVRKLTQCTARLQESSASPS